MNAMYRPIYDAQNTPFPIAGVRVYKNDFEAAKLLVNNIIIKNGMSYLFYFQNCENTEEILHLFSEEASMDIKMLTLDTNLERDTIYILSHNQLLLCNDRKLYLSDKNETEVSELPEDIFFKSVALACKEFSIGIMLSSNFPEDLNALKFIKEEGGTTFVHMPENAQNTISAEVADFVMDASEIPSQMELLESFYDSAHTYSDGEMKILHADDEIYKDIITLLRQKNGNDFSHYKQPTLRRRMARRMAIAKLSSSEKYLEYLKNDSHELEKLFNDILIPVTYFFRDSKIFEKLSEIIFPKIIEKKNEKDSIRIWIAGCSTGEEAYSMAISLHEYLKTQNISLKVQIFASDISENVISKARAGIYSREEVRNISEERLATYFTKIDGSYHICKEIRDFCVFAVHNFVKDPPFAKLDLVSCRNVLIYLDTYFQKKAFNTFHYSLLPTGILVLGKSESTSHAPGLFEPSIKNYNIFGRLNSGNAKVPISREWNDNGTPTAKGRPVKKELSVPDFQTEAQSLLFNNYTPAGVIINENKEIIHFHGNTEAFLLPPQGKPNFNVLKMVREGLAFEVRSALLDAKTTQNTSVKVSIPVKGMDYFADIEVIPLQSKREEKHYLILFRKSSKIIGEKSETEGKKTAEQKRISLLENEIEQLREDIKKVTEDQEVANEELQSANEELLSNSEELQTLNEELETSAEQLQSNNEELLTVNEELVDRQEQLVFARLYAEAIIENIREPLVIIDSELRVKSANASFYNHFGTSEADVEGKIIFDTILGNGNLSQLRSQIELALSEGNKLDNVEVKVVADQNEKIMVMNVRPISNNKLGEPLALLAIEDITEMLATNKRLAASNKDLEENNKQLASFSSVASHDLQEPLRKINLFSSMIMESENGIISEEAYGYLERIMASTTRMQQLIEDLLLYSKINNTKNIIFSETDLSQVIEDATDELDALILEKKAKIIVGEIPSLKIIPRLVRQIFINLVSNSLKYSREDEIPVIKISSSTTALSLNNEDFTNKFLQISLEDNGIGFAQEDASRLFEPFFRLHSKEAYEGSGVGLAICKKVMDLHSGHIDCVAEIGKGSTFNLYFPIFT